MTLTNKGKESAPKVVPILTAAIAAITLIMTFFSIMGGVVAVVLIVVSLFFLILYFPHHPSRNYLIAALFISILSVGVAGFGLILQLSKVQEQCSSILPHGSPNYVACFQEYYSPWKGIAKSVDDFIKENV